MSEQCKTDERINGIVKWYNKDKGFGFIKMGDGRLDVFFHAKQLRESGIHRALEENEKVSFVMSSGPKGLFAEQIDLIQE